MVSVTKTNSTKINIRMKNKASIRITITKKKASRMTRTTKISTQTQTTTIRMDMVMIRLIIRIHLTSNPLTIHTRTPMEVADMAVPVPTTKINLTTTAIAIQKTLSTMVDKGITTEILRNTGETRVATAQRTALMEPTAASMTRMPAEQAKQQVAVE